MKKKMRSLLKDPEELQSHNMPDIDQILNEEAEDENYESIVGNLRPSEEEKTITEETKKRPGRKIKYEDRRFKSTESLKISPSVKLKMEILKSINFDGKPFAEVINTLCDQYVDRDLRAEEREYFKEKYVKDMKDLAGKMKIPPSKQGKINQGN
ncbi:hypothetical protein SAMN04487821_1561 [Enterococcus malodoratus]|jgi:hypothetical protein|uniref:hypothetical protein n=1 Tax=Enterococcus malodoratus TaxID=71451 RepID=UPI0008C53C2C|nr:hypothetical protein [Enterococcus malodoratus]SEU02697.1 hypothetical protein SAMN04487821_1561 [Enterococcus malodoratus]